eukprot:14195857-Heterocapsa_arctica.AAC.1
MDLGQVIEEALGSQISLPKAALVASSKVVSNRVRSALKEKAGFEVHRSKNLGIDCSAGRARPHHASLTTRHK